MEPADLDEPLISISLLPTTPADRVSVIVALLECPEELGGPLISREDALRLLEAMR